MKIVSLSMFVLFEFAVAFTKLSISSKRFKANYLQMETAETVTPSLDFSNVVVSGFISKEKKFSESFVFSRLFSSQNWDSITAVTDDSAFAKKRLVNPKTVYSGLIDVLKIAEVSSTDSLQEVLAPNDAWLCYNIPSKDLEAYASLAAKAGLKRAVFAVLVSPEEVGADVTFDGASSILSAAGVQYTIVKYAGVTDVGESRSPYRIVRGVTELPKDGETPYVSFKDLMVILSETLDIPKTFNNVYGIGPGSKLDTEILVYMKSQGWPERTQVAILMGDLMERIDVKFALEKSKNPTLKSNTLVSPSSKMIDGVPYEGNKLAGFN